MRLGLKLKNISKYTGILSASFLLFISAGITGCEKKGPMEKAGEKMDKTYKKAKNKIEDAGDKIKDVIEDTGDKIKDAAD